MWGFTKLSFKQILKVLAFYLEKQARFIPKKNMFLAVVSRFAKIDPKDGACYSNFQWSFGLIDFCISLKKKLRLIKLEKFRLCKESCSHKELVKKA